MLELTGLARTLIGGLPGTRAQKHTHFLKAKDKIGIRINRNCSKFGQQIVRQDADKPTIGKGKGETA